MIELVCFFRSQGVQWPLRRGDTVRIRRGHDDLGELPADLVIELVAYHLYGLQLQVRMRDGVLIEPPRKPPALMSRGPIPLDVQEARRVRRRGKRA